MVQSNPQLVFVPSTRRHPATSFLVPLQLPFPFRPFLLSPGRRPRFTAICLRVLPSLLSTSQTPSPFGLTFGHSPICVSVIPPTRQTSIQLIALLPNLPFPSS